MGITLNKILNRKQLQPVWMEVGSVRYNVQQEKQELVPSQTDLNWYQM